MSEQKEQFNPDAPFDVKYSLEEEEGFGSSLDVGHDPNIPPLPNEDKTAVGVARGGNLDDPEKSSGKVLHIPGNIPPDQMAKELGANPDSKLIRKSQATNPSSEEMAEALGAKLDGYWEEEG